jgi:hypothetical protein
VGLVGTAHFPRTLHPPPRDASLHAARHDAGAFGAITRRINGGANGKEDRQRRLAAAREVVEVTSAYA